MQVLKGQNLHKTNDLRIQFYWKATFTDYFFLSVFFTSAAFGVGGALCDGIDAEDLPSPAIGLAQGLSPLCNLPVYAIFNRTARKNPPKVLHFPHYYIPLQLLLKHMEASAPTPLIQYVQTGIFYTACRSPLVDRGGRGKGERQTTFIIWYVL